MRRLVYILAGFVLLWVAAGVILPYTIPSTMLRDIVSSAVKTQTGREMTMAGAPEISLFPFVGVKVKGIKLANPPGFGKRPFAEIERLNLRLRVFYLILGDVSISRFEMVRPKIHLAVNSKGEKNWVFKAKKPKDTPPKANDPDDRAEPTDIGVIDTFVTTGGVVTYTNAQTKTRESVTNINLKISIDDLSLPLKARGSLMWNKQKFNIDTRLSTPHALFSQVPVQFRIKFSAPLINGNFTGILTLKKNHELKGKIKLATPNIRNLAKWLKYPLTPGNGLKGLEISAEIDLRKNNLRLNKARIVIDGMRINGKAAIRFTKHRPIILGNFNLDRLDLNKYMKKRKAPAKPVRKARRRAPAWNKDKLNFSALKIADADIKLTTKTIFFKKIKIGQGALSIKMSNGLVTAKTEKLTLYNGTAQGQLKFGIAGAKQVLSLRAKLAGINAFPLLRDMADVKSLEGKTHLEINIATRGQSAEQMAKNLSGRAKIKLNDGAIIGVNIYQALNNVVKSIVGPTQGVYKTAKTKFKTLKATFNIARGIAVNRDLKLVGSGLVMTGWGRISAPKKHLYYKIKPRIYSRGSTFSVTLTLQGPLTNPSVSSDIGDILKVPGKVLNVPGKAVRGIGNAGNSILKSLFGRRRR